MFAGRLVATMVFALVLGNPAQGRTDCVAVSTGLDTSYAYPDTISAMGLRCGEAGGQTFLATDTLIASVAVWRSHVQTPYGGNLKLWITEVDSLGTPDLDRILLEGPIITVPFGDGIHPIKMEWTFDTPFALPRRGTFYLAAQDFCGGHWDLVVNKDNAYTQGSAWRSGISCFSGCYLRKFPDGFSDVDLIFNVGFCSDTPTPAIRRTWGQLKMLYR